MVARLAPAVRAVALGLVLLAGLAQVHGEPARALPADRGAPLLYVALGDSTVEGIGASRPELNYVSRLHRRLVDVYPRAKMFNLGVSGATSADVVSGQLERAVELSPGLVTISVGPNDITRQIPLARYEANLETIFTRLTRETPALVVANSLPDLAITPRFANGPQREPVGQKTVEFNQALRRVAGRFGIVVVDLYEPSRHEVPRHPELVWSDGYHPSDAGYARWAELVWTAIRVRIR